LINEKLATGAYSFCGKVIAEFRTIEHKAYLMKNTIKAACLLAMLALVTVAVQAQTDKRVIDIRSTVAAINNAAAKYKKTKKDVPGISTEGAEATYYRSGKELKKVVAAIYGETFRGTSELYFSGGELIFEYDRVSRYDTQIGLEKPVKVVRIEQMRSYFDKGKLFKLINGAKTIDPKSDDFTQAEKGSQEIVKGILDAENQPST
jgi:hypothetical protein